MTDIIPAMGAGVQLTAPARLTTQGTDGELITTQGTDGAGHLLRTALTTQGTKYARH